MFQRFLRLFVPLLILSAGLGLTFSRMYWGYFLTPPPVPKIVNRWSTIQSITPIIAPETTAPPRLEIAPDWNCSASRQSPLFEDLPYCVSTRCNTSFCDSSRVLISLYNQDLLNQVFPTINPSKLAEIEAAIAASDRLFPVEPGYDETAADNFRGLIIEAQDSAGENYVMVGFNAGQIANDRYPVYEFIFHRTADDTLDLRVSQRFYYDIAGIEGATAGIIFLVFAILSFFLTLIILLIYYLIQLKHRHFS